MGFGESVRTVYSKYATFSGRATRSEYWWFILFYMIAYAALTFVDGALFGSVERLVYGVKVEMQVMALSGIFALASFLPSLGVAVRRLHDTDRSGWWFLIAFVPLIGFIVLLVFFVTDGTRGANRFGPDPKGGDTTGFGGGGGGAYTSSDIPGVKRD
ncbi:MAG: DUF805 domain-containing protein [Rhodobacterales bacterium]|nr:MAG: DUF805 domain-containing protein [Rhodobacterales bacterium]